MEKQLLLMKGMLLGVAADGKLNTNELLFLDLWLKQIGQDNLEGDLLDLSEQISDVLADGIFTEEEHADTLSLLEDIIEYSEIDCDEHALVVLGTMSAICSDGVINSPELHQLNMLIDKHIDIPICKLIKNHLNKKLSEAELLTLFNGITGNNFLSTGSISPDACSFMFDKFDGAPLEGKRVVVTGVTRHFSREEIVQAITLAGATVTSSVSKKTDILIVGEEGSDDYTFGSFGRKFEKALDEKIKGGNIKIYSIQDILEPLVQSLSSISNLSFIPSKQSSLEDILLSCVEAQHQVEITASMPNALTISIQSSDKNLSEFTIQQGQFDNKKYTLKTKSTDMATSDKTKAYTALLTSLIN